MSPDTIASTSPQAPSEVLAQAPSLDGAAVAALVARAHSAQREWWALGAAARSAALAGAAHDLRARRDEVTGLVIREVGKPLGEAAGEVARAIAILEYYAQAAFAPVGDLYPPSLGGLLYSERRPHGVAGLITPWNFPIAIPLWKAAPALISGNAVVLKPSPDALATALMIEELLAPHLPADLFLVAPGGPEAGEALVQAADVVSFTGSAGVGAAVTAAAAAHGHPVQAEMGGQNAAIVLPDVDPAPAAAMIAGAAMGFAGQKCTATRRVLVIGENPGFVDALTAAVRGLAPSDPSEAGVAVGPVINEGAREKVLAGARATTDAGGRVLAGGQAPAREGWFVEPTLVEGVSDGHTLMQEETFGPLAVVHHVRDLEEAITVANGVRFGLATSVHGKDMGSILRAVAQLDTGLIKVNAPTSGVDFYAPFGGEKASSYGLREQGPAALDFYSSTRTIAIAP